MIKLHLLERSRSIRVPWLMEELGIDYEVVEYRRHPQTNLAPPELLELHALGKSPIIVDDDVVIAESGAILEYLIDTYGDGKLRPESKTTQRLAYNYWMHAAEGSFMNMMVMAMLFGRIEAGTPALLRPLTKRIVGAVRDNYLDPSVARLLTHVEQELEKTKWFAGEEFSAADIQMGFVMTGMESGLGLDSSFPNSMRWLQQMRDRPAYQKAVERHPS